MIITKNKQDILVTSPENSALRVIDKNLTKPQTPFKKSEYLTQISYWLKSIIMAGPVEVQVVRRMKQKINTIIF